ncbi:MAG TPA: nuclear transport factor 2 family protein [Acidimicrobiales bacterium]|nr:nuclear transport factor 2 family protein [Acidimicrobiales bacterium]
MNGEDLMAIEQIKQLKARYFRLMDQKRWEEWGDVFTEDVRLRFGPGEEDVVEGRQTVVDYVHGVLDFAVTVHHGHMPEIEVSGTTATGIWAMYDHTDSAWDYSDRRPAPRPGKDPDRRYVKEGFGHYTEEYRLCDDGRWRIASTALSRLRVDRLSGP